MSNEICQNQIGLTHNDDQEIVIECFESKERVIRMGSLMNLYIVMVNRYR